jgi:hypothetical protein
MSKRSVNIQMMKNKMSLKIKNDQKELFSKILKKQGIKEKANHLKNFQINGNTIITARNKEGSKAIQKILDNSKKAYENDNIIKMKFLE